MSQELHQVASGDDRGSNIWAVCAAFPRPFISKEAESEVKQPGHKSAPMWHTVTQVIPFPALPQCWPQSSLFILSPDSKFLEERARYFYLSLLNILVIQSIVTKTT